MSRWRSLSRARLSRLPGKIATCLHLTALTPSDESDAETEVQPFHRHRMGEPMQSCRREWRWRSHRMARQGSGKKRRCDSERRGGLRTLVRRVPEREQARSNLREGTLASEP